MAICIKLSAGFTNLSWAAVCVVAFGYSFTLPLKVLRQLPLALAYGMRGGVGAIATACTGYILRGEPFTILMGAGVEVVLAGIAIFGKGFAKDEAR